MNTERSYRLLCTSTPTQRIRGELEQIGEVDILARPDRDVILENIEGYDAVLADGGTQFNDELFRQAGEKLKVVARVGIGYDNVNLEDATRHGIMVTNTPGVMAESVAEHCILLMLAAAKSLTQADREMREGVWDWPRYRGTELLGKTLGQIGLGRIGYQVAKKAKAAFNMQPLVYDPYADQERTLEVGGKAVTFSELLESSDVISVNVPLNEETHHLLSEDEFAEMKNTAIVVNTGRGSVIDEQSLIEALKEGEIAKAGLDVLEQEPPAEDNPLLQMDNVVLTPHQGSNTITGVENMFMSAARSVKQVLAGERPTNLVNKEV